MSIVFLNSCRIRLVGDYMGALTPPYKQGHSYSERGKSPRPFAQFFWRASVNPLSQQRRLLLRIIRVREVIRATVQAGATISNYMRESAFPRPVSLGDRCVGWIESEIQDWIFERIEERDKQDGIV